MKKLVLALVIAAAAHTGLWAQETDIKEAIRENLSQSAGDLSDAEARLEKAASQLEQAQNAMQAIEKMKSDAQKEKKSKKKKILKEAQAKEGPAAAKTASAYTMMEKAQEALYGIYKLDIEDKLADVPDKKLDKVSELLENSENAWAKAEAASSAIPSGKNADPKSIISAHKEYAALQAEAIDYQVQNLAEILGIFDEPEPPEEAIPPVDETMASTEPEPDRIHYKVQIAADVTPLTLEFLQKKVYNSSEVINNEYTDGTYRYLVGRFDTYEQAKAAKARMKVKGAFIVKYKNGKRQNDIRDDSDTY